MAFFFNVPCKFTPPLNTDPVNFGLTPFDWLSARTLICNIASVSVNLVIRGIDDMEHVSSAKSICKLFTIPFQYT